MTQVSLQQSAPSSGLEQWKKEQLLNASNRLSALLLSGKQGPGSLCSARFWTASRQGRHTEEESRILHAGTNWRCLLFLSLRFQDDKHAKDGAPTASAAAKESRSFARGLYAQRRRVPLRTCGYAYANELREEEPRSEARERVVALFLGRCGDSMGRERPARGPYGATDESSFGVNGQDRYDVT